MKRQLILSKEMNELFDRLYRDNQTKVYRLALSLTGNVQDAEDITQEVFYRAFRSYETFREDSSFFTWIYRITINVSNDYLKRRTKPPVEMLTGDMGFSLEEIIDPNPANNPETELLAFQARIRCLHAMTECLPTDQRIVFCLAVSLGLPHKAIAEILDCSVGSVKTKLHRARKRWFGYMENKCQLIKRSNPCNCKQFVRFGLSQGWISREFPLNTRPRAGVTAREDIRKMSTLRDIYRGLYEDRADEAFVQRIKEGIKNSEWSIFSDTV